MMLIRGLFSGHFFLRSLCWYCLIVLPSLALAQLANEPALAPREVAVVASLHAPNSVDIAKEYMKARGIPSNQLLVTGMPLNDKVTRKEYNQYIAGPLKDFLVHDHLDHVRCVVLIYGVPLKVMEPEQLPTDKQMERRLREERPAAINDAIKLVQRANALAGAGKDAAKVPQFKEGTSAQKQINELARLVMEDLNLGQQQVDTKSAADKAAFETQRAQLISEAFGDDADGAWRMLRLKAPAPQADLAARKARLVELGRDSLNPATLQELLRLLRKTRGVFGLLNGLDLLLLQSTPGLDWRASVDSELACVFWRTYPLARYQINPLNMHITGKNAPRTLMVCRLDGPDAETVRRMIRDDLAAEKTGLQGKTYIDARGIGGSDPYGRYDNSLVRWAKLIQEKTTSSVTLDQKGDLFAPNTCPDAALYCGWYSLGRYVPAFTWKPGAVGWHIASDEAKTLHKKDAKLWCASILRSGGAATLGPVEEPYLTAFPPPHEFFGLLMTGKFTLADCYWKTVPHVSWMMTLIGDPLYNPYKAQPALDLADFLDTLQGDAVSKD